MRSIHSYLTANENYPAGVSPAHPHFNPPVCDSCGAEMGFDDEECPECGEYVMTEDDIDPDRYRDDPDYGGRF